MRIGAEASTERVALCNIATIPMSEFNTNDGKRTADEQPCRQDGDTNGSETLLLEPTHEHPRHYPKEAHRYYERVRHGEQDLSDYGARVWGLLAYWYPGVITSAGGRE